MKVRSGHDQEMHARHGQDILDAGQQVLDRREAGLVHGELVDLVQDNDQMRLSRVLMIGRPEAPDERAALGVGPGPLVDQRHDAHQVILDIGLGVGEERGFHGE